MTGIVIILSIVAAYGWGYALTLRGVVQRERRIHDAMRTNYRAVMREMLRWKPRRGPGGRFVRKS